MPHKAKAFADLIEHAATAALIVDEQGQIVMLSEMATTIFGYDAGELNGKPVEVLIPERHRAKHRGLFNTFYSHAITRLMGAGRQLNGLRKDGVEIAVEISLSPVMVNDQLYIAAWIRDDEARQALENELRLYHDRLAHMGRVAFVSEMVAGISHELSQPLAAIANFAEAIQMRINSGDAGPGEMKDLTRPLIDQTLRAGEIVRNLRDFITGREVSPKTCSVEHLVNQSVRFMENELLATKTQLDVEFAPDLPEVHCIEIQIAQVLDNVIRNAIQAIESLPIERRRIRLQIQSETDRVRVTISDWGDGLNEKTLERIMDTFFTTKPEGMGVGLAICRTIIERHGGTLHAENGPEGGASFSFTLAVNPKQYPSTR